MTSAISNVLLSKDEDRYVVENADRLASTLFSLSQKCRHILKCTDKQVPKKNRNKSFKMPQNNRKFSNLRKTLHAVYLLLSGFKGIVTLKMNHETQHHMATRNKMRSGLLLLIDLQSMRKHGKEILDKRQVTNCFSSNHLEFVRYGPVDIFGSSYKINIESRPSRTSTSFHSMGTQQKAKSKAQRTGLSSA